MYHVVQRLLGVHLRRLLLLRSFGFHRSILGSPLVSLPLHILAHLGDLDPEIGHLEGSQQRRLRGLLVSAVEDGRARRQHALHAEGEEASG